jgi:hypothetical protein
MSAVSATGAGLNARNWTNKDAGTYITKLPKAEHSAPEWQAATVDFFRRLKGNHMASERPSGPM